MITEVTTMAQYSELGDLYGEQRLGSFEGYGVSNLGQGFGNLGDLSGAASDRLDNEIDQLQNDLYTAQNQVGRGQGHMPGTFRHPSNRGRTGEFALGNTNRLLPQTIQQRQSLGAQPAQGSQDNGASAGEVLTGIGAILGPLAQAGVGIFSASQQAKLEEQRLKSGGGHRGGGGNAALIAALSNQGGGGSSTGIIIAVVAVIMIMGMMMFMMSKKD
jgi:hypothetical protein